MNISEFYYYIMTSLCEAVDAYGETAVFCGDPAKQIPPRAYYYDGSGGVIEVHDLMSALRALQMIANQGEGAQSSIWTGADSAREAGFREVAHYFRFNELHEGRRYREGDTVQSGPTGAAIRVPWNRVVPIVRNVKLSDYPIGEVRNAVYAFNARYCELLATLQEAFTGNPGRLIETVVAMCNLRDDFRRILANPFPGKPGYFCSPTFQFVETKPPTPAAVVGGQTGQCPVTRDRNSNEKTLETLNQAYATGDLQLALSCMSEDVVWDISGPPSVPYAGVFYGHGGFSNFWNLLNDTVTFASAGVTKTLFSENEAIAYGGERGYVKSNNSPYHYDWAILYRFNSNHKITLIRQYYDPARIDAALGAADFPARPAQAKS